MIIPLTATLSTLPLPLIGVYRIHDPAYDVGENDGSARSYIRMTSCSRRGIKPPR